MEHTMGQEDTSPIQEEVKQETEKQEPPKQDGSVESAANALKGLLSEDGTMPDAEDEAPQGQAEEPLKQVAEAPKEAPKAVIVVKLGDKDYSIPVPDDLPEEVKGLVKDGLLMRADYTRKTQEAAEIRKAADAKAAEVMQAYQATTQLADHIAAVKNVEAQLQQLQKLDWQRLEAEDPLGHIKATQAFHNLQSQRQQLYGYLQAADQQMRYLSARQHHEMVQAELPKVKEAIPDFGDAKVKELREGAITHYGKFGITQEHLDRASTAFELAILNDALQYRALQAKQPAVTNKVEKLPPKAIRSGPAQTQDGPQMNQAAMARLQRSGKVEDAAAAIKSLLG